MKDQRELKLTRTACLLSCLFLCLPLMVFGQETDKPAPTPTPSVGAGRAGESGTAQAQPDKPPSLWRQFRFTTEIGGQFVDLSGERPSKFEEFRQVREGFLFRKFRLSSNPEGSPSFFRLIGQGPSERDEHYLLDAGRYGVFRTTVEWQGLPHLYSRGSRSLFGQSAPGVFTIPDNIQQTIQNTPSASVPAVVRGFISSAPLIDLRVRRQTFDLTQRVSLSQHWAARIRFTDQRRFGSRPLGTGSYERVGTATGDTFRVLSVELPESVKYHTQNVTLGTSYVREKWGVNFDYTFSKFDNSIPSITFDNPFRITDLQATGSGGVFDRMAFARGIFALPPSNKSNSVLLSAWLDLPHQSRLSSVLGWSFWRQNEPFVPYTLNSAIVTSGLPAGTSATSPSSLPRPGLQGAVDIFTQDHLFTTHLGQKLSLNLHYRDYDYQNKTPDLLFPGYAAFGESWWRTNINGKPIENEPFSFHRKTAISDVVWDVARPVTLKLEYRWDGLEREHRQVAESNEHTISSQLRIDGGQRFSSRLTYSYANRSPRAYDPGILEYRLLRMFDQSKRLRHNAAWQMQYHLSPQFGLSGTLGYTSDDYDQNFYGLTKYVQGYGSVDLLYTGLENVTFYANYSREQYSSTLQTISKTAVPFDLANRWNRDERDAVNSFGAGITAYLGSDKFFIDAHYALALARTRTNTYNLSAPSPINVLNAQAYPFPDVKTRFHELNTDLSYQITPNVAFGVRYLYEPYRLNDFAWDGLTAYPVDQLPVEQDGRRFLLLDSRYSSSTAHTVGIYLRLTR